MSAPRPVITYLEARPFAESLLYEWWFAVAETLFERVCEVTGLDDEQKEALRQVALRPNDFQVRPSMLGLDHIPSGR